MTMEIIYKGSRTLALVNPSATTLILPKFCLYKNVFSESYSTINKTNQYNSAANFITLYRLFNTAIKTQSIMAPASHMRLRQLSETDSEYEGLKIPLLWYHTEGSGQLSKSHVSNMN